jgi:TetR/AcrR family transcriptional regulator
MARPRASDYDEKRRAILDRSAELFAARGYDRTSVNSIAEACGVSKALLYHYYKDKDELLFDVIRFHLEELLEAVEAVPGDLDPSTRLKALATALLDAYRDADAEHKLQIAQMTLLAPERVAELRGMERELVAVFADAIAHARPELEGTPLLKPVTMSLFGMLNWHYLWFRPHGPLTRADYAELATRIILEGAGHPAERMPDASRRRSTSLR